MGHLWKEHTTQIKLAAFVFDRNRRNIQFSSQHHYTTNRYLSIFEEGKGAHGKQTKFPLLDSSKKTIDDGGITKDFIPQPVKNYLAYFFWGVPPSKLPYSADLYCSLWSLYLYFRTNPQWKFERNTAGQLPSRHIYLKQNIFGCTGRVSFISLNIPIFYLLSLTPVYFRFLTFLARDLKVLQISMCKSVLSMFQTLSVRHQNIILNMVKQSKTKSVILFKKWKVKVQTRT